MRIRPRSFPAVLLILLAAAIAVAAWHTGRAGAQSTYNAGLAVSVRAERGGTRPGQPLLLAVTLANESPWAVEIQLGCDPPVDLAVRDASGQVVWRWHPACVPATSTVRLAAGARREWTASWPATDGTGSPISRGLYTAWGTVYTTPVHAVAGPLLLEVGGDPIEATREHEPTHVPEPTREHEPTRVPPEATRTPTPPAEERAAFPITDHAGRQRLPDVAGDPSVEDCQHLVVWWDQDARQIWGRFVERAWRGEPFLVSGESPANGRPAVAYNRTLRRWLVVWAAETDALGREVRGRLVECGSLEGPVFTVGSHAADDDEPDVAAFGEAFGVVWLRAGEGGARVFGAQIVGTDTRRMVAISPEGHASAPAVSCEPTEPCLVVWTRMAGEARDVVGRYWFPREEYVGDALLEIAVGQARERDPAAAWNGEVDSHLVVWTEEGDVRSRVKARAVYPSSPRALDDYTVGSDVQTVSEDGTDADHADVARLGLDFVVVWAHGDGRMEDVSARRVSVNPDTHALSAHALVAVQRGGAIDRHPAVSSAGDPLALAVWETEWANGAVDIMGRHSVAPRSGGGGLVTMAGPVTALERATGGGHWEMRVDAVLVGDFPCADARIYFDETSSLAPPRNVGDTVTAAGQRLAPPYTCAVAGRHTDVDGGYVPRASVYLPMGRR